MIQIPSDQTSTEDCLISDDLPQSQDFSTPTLIWTEKNTSQFVDFIQQNKHCFLTEQAKRKSKIFILAAQSLGLPSANDRIRRKFDAWIRKYRSIDRLIQTFKDEGSLSKRNGKARAKLAIAKIEPNMGVENRQSVESKIGNDPSFYINDGEITFIN